MSTITLAVKNQIVLGQTGQRFRLYLFVMHLAPFNHIMGFK